MTQLDVEASTLPPHGDETTPRPFRVPALTVIHHPDLTRVGEQARMYELLERREVMLSRLAPLFSAPGEKSTRALADPFLSRKPVSLARVGDVVRVHPGAIELRADGERRTQPFDVGPAELARGVVLTLSRRVVLLLHQLGPALPLRPRLGLVGDSESIEGLRGDLLRVAAMDVPVLLRGESGSGKELVARALHDASRRRTGPLVSVNMAAIPATTAAAELFGHGAGAFTGAKGERAGYFSAAEGGTLFLDEVGETPGEIQPMLLRALESGEIQPVGGARRSVDVRVVTATDSDLEALVAAGRFREALYHRLSVFPLRVPPLRERRDDIGRLVRHFLIEALAATGRSARVLEPGSRGTPWAPADIVERLALHEWPGNVRQLRNAVVQLVIETPDPSGARSTECLDAVLGARRPAADGERATPSTAGTTFSPAAGSRSGRVAISDDELLSAMRQASWSAAAAARLLRISRPMLYALIDRSPRLRKAKEIDRDELLRCFEQCDGSLEAMAAKLEVSKRGLRIRLRDEHLL